MSDAGSSSRAGAEPSGDAPFVENDAKTTRLPYDHGGLPVYVGIAWVGFLIAYVAVMLTLSLPDLRAWLAR